jgi:hypothetical protein
MQYFVEGTEFLGLEAELEGVDLARLEQGSAGRDMDEGQLLKT